ncbi:MAG: ribonuclease H-like domain-containing protein [Candidatus Liptonbacteria bacterium]|nr:ribonuclease H-like domain-containing protein [Candidatus Liptonbacteria bacterium]
MDTLVFDIETQNFFTDPDVGWDNFDALKISAVGVYSYAQDTYSCFAENELEKLTDIFHSCDRIVGFSINRYDVPVLNLHFQRLGPSAPRIWGKERVDLSEEIERMVGQRISLSKLSEANLGVKKDRHGSEAIGLWKDGKIEELKSYCLNDVKLTKELYDLYQKDRSLLVPNKMTGEVMRVSFASSMATLF